MKHDDELVDFWEGVELDEGDDTKLGEIETTDETKEEDKNKGTSEEVVETKDDDSEEEIEKTTDETDTDDSEKETGTDPEDESIIGNIQKNLGFEFEDEEFEDNEEGIQKLVERASDQLSEQKLKTVFEEYPDVKELYEYVQLGGNPENFIQTKFPQINYSEVEYSPDDEEQHIALIRAELALRGYEGNQIEAEITDYKNGGILDSKAKRALETLKVKQEESKNSLLEEQKETFKAQQKQAEEYWKSIETKIEKSEEIKGMKIPSKDKDPFFQYLTKPVQDGKSQRDLDVETADEDIRLAIDYLLFKKLNLNDIITKKAKDLNAKSLRDRLSKDRLGGKREERKEGSADIADIASLDEI